MRPPERQLNGEYGSNQSLQPTAPLCRAFDVDLSYVHFNSDSS